MKWMEINLLAPASCVEALSAVCNDLGLGGVVIEHSRPGQEQTAGLFPVALDTGLEPKGSNHCIVKAYVPENKDILPDLRQKLTEVEAFFGVKCRFFIKEVREEDWAESWKQYYHVLRIGRKFLIKPSWEPCQSLPGDLVIEIDPGMAFGTGLHVSTRFCMEFLEKYIQGGEIVVDAGCGSGILALAAAKLGAQRVLAVDLDEVAIKVSRENIWRNHLSGRIEVMVGDIIPVIRDAVPDFIVANITADVLVRLIPSAAGSLKTGGYFVGSGIVESGWESVRETLAEHGLIIIETMQEEEWIGVITKKG